MSILEKTPRAHKGRKSSRVSSRRRIQFLPSYLLVAEGDFAAYFHDTVNCTILLSKKYGSFTGLLNKIAELALTLLVQLLSLILFGDFLG